MSPEASALVAQMPATLPKHPIEIGDTWITRPSAEASPPMRFARPRLMMTLSSASPGWKLRPLTTGIPSTGRSRWSIRCRPATKKQWSITIATARGMTPMCSDLAGLMGASFPLVSPLVGILGTFLAIGVIIAQNEANANALPFSMGGDATITGITISGVMVSKADGVFVVLHHNYRIADIAQVGEGF